MLIFLSRFINLSIFEEVGIIVTISGKRTPQVIRATVHCYFTTGTLDMVVSVCGFDHVATMVVANCVANYLSQRNHLQYDNNIISRNKEKSQSLLTGSLVEHRGFEPLTSTMRTLRATNCANAPRMIGGFVQTSVETASRNCTARTQREPSFHDLLAVLICKNYVRTKLAEHIIPRPMGECKGCFCKFIEDCMIFPGKT